jgi:hypothetical protein
MAERKVINTKDSADKDVIIVVTKPNAKNLTAAQIVSSNTFTELVRAGVMLRTKLTEELTKQGLWDDAKEAEIKELATKINEGERKLAAGGAGGFKKSEARQLALDMRGYRIRQTELLSIRTSYDEWTVEGQAENARFDYLVSLCTTWEDTRPCYTSLEDYRERATEPYSVAAAEALAEMMYKFDTKWVFELPENKFLKEQGFVDDKFRLINKDGKLINTEGKLINENGRFVDAEGNFVDASGKRVDDKGNAVEEFVPYASEE